MSLGKAARAERLQSTINDMLKLDETISLRTIMKRLPDDFPYPNAITRPIVTRELYDAGVAQQKKIRTAAEQFVETRAELQAKIDKQALSIKEQQTQIQILVASHRAMYAAVGELGGTKAWLRFFEKHQTALATLDSLQARPTEVSPIRTSMEIVD